MNRIILLFLFIAAAIWCNAQQGIEYSVNDSIAKILLTKNARLDYIGMPFPNNTYKGLYDSTRHVNIAIGANSYEIVDDTTVEVNILYQFAWYVDVTYKNGIHRNYITSEADTINYNNINKIYYSTSFAVSPRLLNQTIALYYGQSGDVCINLNHENVLATGSYLKYNNRRFSKVKEWKFVYFSFKDTTAQLEVCYIPNRKLNQTKIKLAFFRSDTAEWIYDKVNWSMIISCSVGFYYLAFGFIFLILFAFYKEIREHLYISLFCTCFCGFSFRLCLYY